MANKKIGTVIEELDEIIAYAKREHWRIGYFAALYSHVTRAFDRAIRDDVFHDSQRIERLAVVFFDRFLDAVDDHRGGVPATQSWQIAFDAAERRRPIILTHLLLGMNAHINFDLGLAVADTVDAQEMPGFKDDYDRMNELLASLVGVVERDMSHFWPWLGWLHHVLGRVETGAINFSMRVAREVAWDHAGELVRMAPEEREQKVAAMDKGTRDLGWRILHPGALISAVTFLMRLEQHGTVPHIIDVLVSDSAHAHTEEASAVYLTRWRDADRKRALEETITVELPGEQEPVPTDTAVRDANA